MKYLFHLTVEEFEKLISEIIDKKLNPLVPILSELNAIEEKPISRKEAAEFLQVSTVTLDRYRRLDYIEAEQCIGKPVRYMKSKLLLNKKRKKH